MDCIMPGFSVHGIPQARILEWVVIYFSRASSRLRDRTCISCIAGRFFLPLNHQRSITCWIPPKYYMLIPSTLLPYITSEMYMVLSCSFYNLASTCQSAPTGPSPPHSLQDCLEQRRFSEKQRNSSVLQYWCTTNPIYCTTNGLVSPHGRRIHPNCKPRSEATSVQFSSVSRVQLFSTPWTAAH